MRKIAFTLLSTMLLLAPQLRAQEEEMVYKPDYEFADSGFSRGDAGSEAIGASMFGWGILMIVGITVLSLVVKSSTASSS